MQRVGPEGGSTYLPRKLTQVAAPLANPPSHTMQSVWHDISSKEKTNGGGQRSSGPNKRALATLDSANMNDGAAAAIGAESADHQQQSCSQTGMPDLVSKGPEGAGASASAYAAAALQLRRPLEAEPIRTGTAGMLGMPVKLRPITCPGSTRERSLPPSPSSPAAARAFGKVRAPMCGSMGH